ncbi:zinc finger protein 830 [Salmo salar]|uniref:Zinc finger protein 830 n=1 Tax=Salmo salar TaxID=8030 RepID=A0A1S3R499_SALSA|nr:zinc finger protein 830-like [Salmo salar]|eukprot:XP_014046559.1 PREDICTED: zinc finger protein 830-like [Salmo salar]
MPPKNKLKKVIHQDELRRLMREKQRQTIDKKKRVESPYAKYNSLDHLSCVLCNERVKNELLWQTHILGKQHKEKVSELKGSKQSSTSQGPQTPLKRKALDSEDTNGKKFKPVAGTEQLSMSGLPDDFFAKPAPPGPKKLPGILKKTTSAGLSLLAGVYDEEEAGDQGADSSLGVQKGEPAPGLPSDFFDNSTIPAVPPASHSGSILKPDETEKSVEKGNTPEALPEGFFDDPVRDAKVRNVDAPKDQMDKEWEEFQKEMRQVNTKSEAIVAEDDEEGRLERQIDEIDEQIECYRRVEVLRDKQDVVKKVVKEKTEDQEDSSRSDEDEEELLHLLSRDWRAKGALA